MSDSNAPEHVTIVLTGRPPVTVRAEHWPVVASARAWDNTYEFQADRRWRVTVRAHDNGRHIVYGAYSTCYQGERDRRGGELVPAGGNVCATIHRVVQLLALPDYLAEECIAGLPALEIA